MKRAHTPNTGIYYVHMFVYAYIIYLSVCMPVYAGVPQYAIIYIKYTQGNDK